MNSDSILRLQFWVLRLCFVFMLLTQWMLGLYVGRRLGGDGIYFSFVWGWVFGIFFSYLLLIGWKRYVARRYGVAGGGLLSKLNVRKTSLLGKILQR
jgi:hypothetical protein